MQSFVSRYISLASACALALVISGCTSTAEECDPSKDVGFFNKMGCAVSGAYGERIEAKEQQVADLKAENARLNALAREYHNQDAFVKASISEQQRVLDSTREQLYALEDSLRAKQAFSNKLQKQVDDAHARLDELSKSNQAPTQESAELKAKKAEIARLEQILLDISNEASLVP